MTSLPMAPPRRVPRRALMSLSLAGVLVSVALAPVSAAEGPGYGATADELAVSWRTGPSVQAAGDAFASSAPRLHLHGVGYRAGAPTQVRLGDESTSALVADDTGTIEATFAVPAGAGEPGTSIVAEGVTPGGSRRVLIGTVPPLPAGRGPADLVPFLVAGLAVAAVAYSRRGRERPSGG